MTKVDRKFLIAILGDSLELHLADMVPRHLESAGVMMALHSEEFVGFYDALRNKTKSIIGIRLGITSDEIEAFIAGRVPPYVHMEKPLNNTILELCWDDRANIVEEFSDDQAMGSHGVYWDGDQLIGFYFDLTSLYSADLLLNERFVSEK